MIEERYRLAVDRIGEMRSEQTVQAPFTDYFHKMAEFAMMIAKTRDQLSEGVYWNRSQEELAGENRRLYEDILPGAYERSYADPSYAVRILGDEYGQILSFLYTELRGSIAYVFEGKTEYLDILFELLIEVYNQFEEEAMPDPGRIKDSIYWYASDYCDVFVADRLREQIDPEGSFAADIIRDSQLEDLRYLYHFGEYIRDRKSVV